MEDIGSSEASLYWRYWDLNPFRFSLLPYSACSHQGRTLLWARMQRNQLTLGWKLWSCEPSKSVILLSWFIPGVCYTDKNWVPYSLVIASAAHPELTVTVSYLCDAFVHHQTLNCTKPTYLIHLATACSSPFMLPPKWLPLSHETALPQISPSPAHLIH